MTNTAAVPTIFLLPMSSCRSRNGRLQILILLTRTQDSDPPAEVTAKGFPCRVPGAPDSTELTGWNHPAET